MLADRDHQGEGAQGQSSSSSYAGIPTPPQQALPSPYFYHPYAGLVPFICASFTMSIPFNLFIYLLPRKLSSQRNLPKF